MDHDREINALISQSKSLFLQELGREFRERQKRYNLDDEFAKTKKNRSPVIAIVVSVITVLLLGGAFLVSNWINASTANMDVGIESAFSDVNLRDVLDTVKRNEADMERAQERLRELIAQRDRRIQTAQTSAEQSIALLSTQGLSQTAINRESAVIEAALEEEIQRIHDEFAPQIAEAEALIAEIQARIDQYDARQLEQAREQEEVLNNQQQLFELERRELQSSHQNEIDAINEAHAEEIAALEQFRVETVNTLTDRLRREQAAALAEQFALYNPVFTEEEILAILAEGPGAGNGPSIGEAPGFPAASRAYLQSQSVQELAELYTKLESVFTRLDAVPYENSTADSLALARRMIVEVAAAHMRAENQLLQTIGARDTTISGLRGDVSRLEQELAQTQRIAANAILLDTIVNQHEFGLRYAGRMSGDTGFIIDPRNSQEILVFTTNPELLRVGMEGLVFREDSRLIGRIRITSIDRPTTAALVSLQEGESLAPYDSLVFEYQSNEATISAPNQGDTNEAL